MSDLDSLLRSATEIRFEDSCVDVAAVHALAPDARVLVSCMDCGEPFEPLLGESFCAACMGRD